MFQPSFLCKVIFRSVMPTLPSAKAKHGDVFQPNANSPSSSRQDSTIPCTNRTGSASGCRWARKRIEKSHASGRECEYQEDDEGGGNVSQTAHPSTPGLFKSSANWWKSTGFTGWFWKVTARNRRKIEGAALFLEYNQPVARKTGQGGGELAELVILGRNIMLKDLPA